MIIPSSSFASVSSIKKPTASAAPDITPNAVNWGDIAYDGTAPLNNVQITAKQITGINQTITLKVGYSSSTTDIYYRIAANGNNDNTYVTDAVWSGMGYTLLANNAQFTVSNNNYVEFTIYPNGNYLGLTPLHTITVTNVTDSNTVLDTFNASASG